ncbi:MAG: CvpA family protein [Pseudomonadota bacterium]|nr:CvpA family protein [Pseudomonadota bacterium]
MATLDIVFLVIVGLSAGYGLMRGLIKEVFSLLIWLISFAVALSFNSLAATWMESIHESENIRHVLGFIVLFLSTFLFGSALYRLAKSFIDEANLGFVDRLFGVVFGFLRGFIVITVALLAVNLVLSFSDQKLSEFEFWQESQFAPIFADMQNWALEYMDFDEKISVEQLKENLEPTLP